MKKNEVYGRSVPINFNPLFRVMKLCLLFTVMLNLSVVAATIEKGFPDHGERRVASGI